VPEVGLIVTAEDKAKAALEAIGSAGKASLEGIRGAAGKAGDAFKMLGKGVVVFNQAMELGRKAMNAFRIVVTDSIKTALNFRKIGDPAIEAFRRMEREAQIFRARIGDIFIPLAQGLMDAFNQVGGSITDWINLNRKLIATNIATWMADIARVAVEGVAFGILQVTRVWAGWLEIVALVRGGVEKFFSGMMEGIGFALEGWAFLSQFLDKDMSASLMRTREQVLSLGETFSRSGDEHLTELAEIVAAQDERERKILDFKKTAVDFVGEAEIAMLKRIKTSRIGGIKTIEEQQKALDKLREAEKKAADEARKRRDAQIAIGAAMASNLQAYMTSEEDAHDRRRALLFSTMQTAIAASSTEAAVKAIAAHTHIPFVGVAIGLSFAAAAVAAIAQWANTKFDTGGVFRSSSGAGPAILHDKERVLTTRQTEAFEQLVGLLSGRAGPAGALAGAGAGGGTFVYQQTNNSFIPPSNADFLRAHRQQDVVRKQAERRGMTGATARGRRQRM
jgi:hypothetical protein